ncbi:MAG: protein kinase family protein, partial [Clostridia bacterium]|nr:protein kinase family protein [Clostridia bacterium]
MNNTKMSLRIIEESVDPTSKRGIRAVLSDGFEEKEKLIYPLESGESEAFFEDLKKLRHEFLPRIEGYVDQGGRKLALTAPAEGRVLAECRETVSEKNAIEIAKDLADTMEGIHEQGFAFRDLSARDILINEDGLVLPPPAWPATEENILLDFGSVGGICYELLTGLEYKPGTAITEDVIPLQVPYGAKLAIVNSTSRDASLNYDNARDMIRAFDAKKRKFGSSAAPSRRPSREERLTDAASSGLGFDGEDGFGAETAPAPRRTASAFP